uniref:ATP synthase subunit a n=1 Tax=Zea mays subsp. mays TaxID=381124 RepID=Q1KK81_MAIZE|nr:ATPase subunit 6 [Zea mays subsp. mays]ABL96308.1 ATPase subunit 6 [Zea mays subsp. mays]
MMMMTRWSSTDMKRRNRILANMVPIRNLSLPDYYEYEEEYHPVSREATRGVCILLRIDRYLSSIGRSIQDREVLRDFRQRLLFPQREAGYSFSEIYDDIRAHGVEASRLGQPLRDLYDEMERNGEIVNNGSIIIPGGGGPVTESPLDQFGIHPILDLNIGKYYVSFTNLSLSMLLTLGLVLLLVFVVTKKGGGKSVPNAFQSLVELIYDFVPNLVNEQIGGLSGNVKHKFFPCISVTFTFSLFRNPQGMIPFSFTVTSHFLITLALSFSIFIGITIVGFQRHGLHFFSFLLPAGVPLPLAPFLVLLELISHCFRALSSGIRLFANMMAGHSSVKILSGFAWTMLFLNNIFYFLGDLGPLFIVLALTGLELGVAISQAHVSTISICIYLNDATNLH